jgi:hypothetical protein
VDLSTTQTLTNKTLTSPTITSPTITGTPSITGYEQIVQGTAQSPAAGATAVSFTGVPSWAKRITLIVNNATATSTTPITQLGSGSYTTSGYVSSTFLFNSGGTFYSNNQNTAGFPSPTYSVLILTLLSASSNTWAVTGSCEYPASYSGFIAGSITLAGTLDRIQVNAGFSAGNTFAGGGTINIIYEG